MATKIECAEHIPGYLPNEVFDVGTRFDTLPTGHGFEFGSEPGVDRFDEGVTVHLGLVAAGHLHQIDCTVTEFVQDNFIKIEGQSRKVGKAAVWLSLTPQEKISGTDVIYGLRVDFNLLSKGLELPIRHFLRSMLPNYSAQYRQNVISVLDERYGIDYQKAI